MKTQHKISSYKSHLHKKSRIGLQDKTFSSTGHTLEHATLKDGIAK
jgi:hypothetical protein